MQNIAIMDVKNKSSVRSNRLMERRYRQVLEEEQKSLARNKKLLEDIDRLGEEMKYFHSEYKEDEKRLRQAKDKFLQYVKSVYPKWTEDLRKWRAAKKQESVTRSEKTRTSFNPQSKFHSPGKRNLFNFIDSERSISRSGLLEGDSPEYSGNRIESPKDMMGSHMDEMGHPNDRIESRGTCMMGSYRDRMRHPMDTVGSSSDMLGYPSGRMGNMQDRVIYPWDKVGHTGDTVVSPSDRMEYAREIATSSRGVMNHSKEEIGLARDTIGYSRNYMRYPRSTMYNGGPWMYPHFSPPGIFPSTGHQYFLPMPAYGVPRWSTPGYMYDHPSMSHPHARQYHDVEFNRDESHSFPKDVKERSENVSFERDGRKEGMQRETLPNARNNEYDSEQRNLRDVNPSSKDLTGHHTAENAPENENYPAHSCVDIRQSQHPRRSRQELDIQLDKERERGYEKNAKTRELSNNDLYVEERRGNREVSPSFGAQNDSQVTPRDRELVKDHERRQDLEKSKRQPHLEEVNKWMASDENKVNHDPQSKHFDASSQNRSYGKEYLVEPRKETRLMQLRSEGSGYGSRESMNTDSVSLPTIHHYEGDIRDVFSDISSSESLHQDGGCRVGTKHSKSQDPQKVESKVSNDAGGSRTSKQALTREVTESKQSVVEDLIGDDVSDFQVSEEEISEDDLVGAGNELEPPEKPAKREVGDRSGGGRNEAEFEDIAGQGSHQNERAIHHKDVAQSDVENQGIAGDEATKSGNASNENESQHAEVRESLPPSGRDTSEFSEVLEITKDNSKENNVEQNDIQSFNLGHDDYSVSEELPTSDTFENENKRNAHTQVNVNETKTDAEVLDDMKVDLTRDGKNENEHVEVNERSSSGGILSGAKVVERKDDQSIEEEVVEEVQSDDGVLLSEDEKSKTGVLEEVSFSTGESSSETLSAHQKNERKRSEIKAKESVSYSEDFEDEKSIPLTQSAAYQKMLSTVDISDEDEDIEGDFLEGTMSEANTTAQSTQNMLQTSHDSGTSAQAKQTAKSSKSKPTLSLFSSGEQEDFGNSFGKDNDGVLSGSWKSSEASFSPPLPADTTNVAETGKVQEKEEGNEEGKEKVVSVVGETWAETEKNQAKAKEIDTKTRIQEGFWNHSDSESEVDLQISHGGNENNVDDDDDFDFYS